MLVSKLALALDSAGLRMARRALGCAVLVLAQLLALAHAGLVEHRTCALHGEAVHTRHAAPAATAEPPRPTACSAARDATDDDHDHCACMAAGRERFVHSSCLHAGLCQPVPEHATGLPPAVAPPSSITLLSLAPKSSPPA